MFPRGVSLIYLFFLRKAKLWKKISWCWKSQSILEVIAWKMVWCLSYKHSLIGFFFVSKIESSKSVNLNVFTLYRRNKKSNQNVFRKFIVHVYAMRWSDLYFNNFECRVNSDKYETEWHCFLVNKNNTRIGGIVMYVRTPRKMRAIMLSK